jgi:TolB-like protein
MKKTTFLAILLVLFLVIVGYLIIQNLLKPNKQVEKSIAVLPFRNDSTNDTNSYFINGLMEEILNNLIKVEGVKVLSRTSVEPYKNSTLSIPEIGGKLSVNYIVEGNGQKTDNKYRLNVQLINAHSGTSLWSETYDYELIGASDIYNIQTQISQSIADEIYKKITPKE